MKNRVSEYIDIYTDDCDFSFLEIRRHQVKGVHITVEISDQDNPKSYRIAAHIKMEKNHLTYECEGIERHSWDFFPVTVEGKDCILFSKTLYGFTLLDAETLTEIYDFFPEKIFDCQESFIITHACTFGKYLIFDGCYWGCCYCYAAYDPKTHHFLNLTKVYDIDPGDHHAQVWGGSLHLLGDTPEKETYEVKVQEIDIDQLMLQEGTTDF